MIIYEHSLAHFHMNDESDVGHFQLQPSPQQNGILCLKKTDFGRGRHLLAHADWRIPHRVHSTHWQLQIVELSKASSDWSCQRNPPMRRWKIKQCQGPIP